MKGTGSVIEYLNSHLNEDIEIDSPLHIKLCFLDLVVAIIQEAS